MPEDAQQKVPVKTARNLGTRQRDNSSGLRSSRDGLHTCTWCTYMCTQKVEYSRNNSHWTMSLDSLPFSTRTRCLSLIGLAPRACHQCGYPPPFLGVVQVPGSCSPQPRPIRPLPASTSTAHRNTAHCSPASGFCHQPLEDLVVFVSSLGFSSMHGLDSNLSS